MKRRGFLKALLGIAISTVVAKDAVAMLERPMPIVVAPVVEDNNRTEVIYEFPNPTARYDDAYDAMSYVMGKNLSAKMDMQIIRTLHA